MKIVILYEKLLNRGGLERYVLEFTRRLAARHEVHVVTSKTASDLVALPVSIHRVQRLPSALLNLLWFNHAGAARAARLGADAVLGFGRTTQQDLHRAGGGCHAVYSRTQPFLKRWRLKNRIELLLERSLYRGKGTALFVFNSTAVREQVRRIYEIPEDRSVVIHTPVDSARYSPSTEDQRTMARSSLGLGLEEDVFLFTSMEHKRKGLPTLIEAWPRVRATLVIAGAPLPTGLARRIRDLQIAKHIRYVGGGHDMRSLCHAADFFVHPTRYDACANTVLQAMASGLVVLVSERDGAIDHIREDETGFILRDPLDPNRIASRCQKLLSLTSQERNRIGNAARETISQLTWDRHLAAWEEHISNINQRIDKPFSKLA